MEEKDSKLEVFPGIFVGDIVVSLQCRSNTRKIGDIFQVLLGSIKGYLYYEYNINSEIGIIHSCNFESWRKATSQETEAYNKGIRKLSDMENKSVEDERTPQIGEWYVVLDVFEAEDTLGKCHYSQGEVFQVFSLQKSNLLKSKWWLHKDENKAIGLGSCRKALESEIPKKPIPLEGRYIKVLNAVGKAHYPCFKGDYLLFSRKIGGYEHWGEEDEKGGSRYHGMNVHLNPDFELMPEGFVPPPNNMNIMEEQYKPWLIRYSPEWTEELFNATIEWCESIREKHPWQVKFKAATSDYTLKGLKNCITGGGYICFWGSKKKEDGAMYLYGINNNPDSLQDKTITISQLKSIIGYIEPSSNESLLEESKIAKKSDDVKLLHDSWYIRYTPEFTEDLYNKLINWVKPHIKNENQWRGWYVGEPYENFKRNGGLGGYFTFDPNTMAGIGVDNNEQRCQREIFLPELKTIINYKESKVTDIETKNNCLLEEANIKYPTGTRFRCVNVSSRTITVDKNDSWEIGMFSNGPYIMYRDSTCQGFYAYLNNKWAEIVNTPAFDTVKLSGKSLNTYNKDNDPWDFDEVRKPLKARGEKSFYQPITINQKPYAEIKLKSLEDENEGYIDTSTNYITSVTKKLVEEQI
jgi:hypothetical protein